MGIDKSNNKKIDFLNPLVNIKYSILLTVGMLLLTAPALLRISPAIEYPFIFWKKMQFNTALGLIFLTISFILHVRGKLKLSSFFATFVFVLSLSTAIQHIFDVNLGVDELFAKATGSPYPTHPGRMALNTAIAILTLSVSKLLHLSFRKSSRALEICAILSGSAALLGLLTPASIILGIDGGYDIYSISHMALPTAVGIAFLGTSSAAFSILKLAWLPKSRVLLMPTAAFLSIVLLTLISWQYTLSEQRRAVEP